MAQPFDRHDRSPPRWLRRLDHAAERINPYLGVLAIGLVILDATCLCLQMSTLPVVHLRDVPSCLTTDPTAGSTTAAGPRMPY